MRMIQLSEVRRAVNDQSGQVLPWTAFVLVCSLGMGGLVMDVGRAYVAHSALQNAANAAALAAAGVVYNTSSTNNSTNYATNYGGSSGSLNSGNGIVATSTTVTTKCLNSLMPSGQTCGTGSPSNAVQVTEAGTLKTLFMPIVFGPTSLSISATATASMQGGSPQPWNLAIILDGTASMSDAPPSGSCTGYSTEFSCALGGVKALLGHINPCAGVSNCTTSNATFRVALFSFPNVSTTTVQDDWTCGGTPTNEQYTLPNTNLTTYPNLSYGGWTATYEDTPVGAGDGDANGFVSNFYSSGSTGNLNTGSDIVKAVNGCLKNPGGESTYYASVIYAAQAALIAENAAYGGKNAIIMLSDGQANAVAAKFPSGAVTPAADGYAGSAMTATGYYPSTKDECQQAIMAAQSAQTAGTTVYAVAFNSEANGCGVSGGGATVTDTSLIATATSGNAALSLATLTPCITMKNIASPATSAKSYFYADTSSSSSGCTDSAHTTNQINTIFDAIAATFTTPRLIPNNAT